MHKLTTLALAAGMVLAGTSAAAADLTILGGFDYSTQGSSPHGLTFDTQGNLWGVLQNGYYDYDTGRNSNGAIFKYTAAHGVEIVKQLTDYAEGANPLAPLTLGSDGKLYGMLVNGSNNLFSITSNGTFTALGTTPSSPYGALVQGSNGALYGQTIYGGNVTYDGGLLYKYENGVTTTLADIGTVGGRQPRGGLAIDNAGNIYGATSGTYWDGGSILYKYDSNGQLTNLHNFVGSFSNDGSGPTLGPDGNIYGIATTFSLGGSIYKFDTGTQSFSTIFDFAGSSLKSPAGKLLFDANGTMWGVTQGDWYGNGSGVFSLTSSGVFTDVFSFPYGPPTYDQPFGAIDGLTADAQGNLYGVLAYGGGTFNGGGLFKLANTGFAVAGGGGGGGGPGAVPEPASWALLIAGFGLSGVAMRRRRRLVVAA